MIRAVAADLRATALDAVDASGYFPALYSRVTERVADMIDEGAFDDADRMDLLATTFAGYHSRAMEGGLDRPACWQAAIDVAGRRDLLIVQHLLLGINAHVNHDLPQAVVDVADGSAISVVRRDFDAINDVLAGVQTEVLRDLDGVARWTSRAAMLGGGRLFNFSLRVARDQAWAAAGRLAPLEEEARRAEVAEIDRLVAVLALLVTRPPPAVRLVLPLLRRLEDREPATIVRALLGSRGMKRPRSG